jgi:hypothetical protein
MQTGKKNPIPIHLGNFEKFGLTRFALTPPSELWKLKPSETIAVNDPVIGSYKYVVSANLVAGTNERLAASVMTVLAAAARLLVGR